MISYLAAALLALADLPLPPELLPPLRSGVHPVLLLSPVSLAQHCQQQVGWGCQAGGQGSQQAGLSSMAGRQQGQQHVN
jgi:hypothetical protein